MIGFKSFITEEIIYPSTEPNTLSLWHGGNLDYGPDENFTQSKGRFEFAPGLYCTTSYQVVQKYKKGSRKLYLLTVAKGKSLEESTLPTSDVIKFINNYAIAKKRKEILERISARNKEGQIDASIFMNLLLNYEAVKTSVSNVLRKFLVEHGIDYSVVDNAFGWGERMVIVFNMRKIVDIKQVKTKDKIETYDLPTEWNK